MNIENLCASSSNFQVSDARNVKVSYVYVLDSEETMSDALVGNFWQRARSRLQDGDLILLYDVDGDEKLKYIQYNVEISGEILIEEIDFGGGGSGGSTTAQKVSWTNENYPDLRNVQVSLDALWNKVDYVEPQVTSFTMAPATTVYEVGTTIMSITFNWDYNKPIVSQTLTDVTLANANVRTATWTGVLRTNKTFTLTGSDGEKNATSSKTISFQNKIYWGGATEPGTYNSAFILGLDSNKFATAKKGTYALTINTGEYGYIAYPVSFGALESVWIGGFEVTVVDCGTISFTNASGGVANYRIYRTGRSGLGSITMEVK